MNEKTMQADVLGETGTSPDIFKEVTEKPTDEKPKRPETRGRKSKAKIEAEKKAELELSKNLAKQAIPTALKALEGLALSRIKDKTLRKQLELTKDESANFTDAFIVVAEKRQWFNLSDTPEVALVLVALSILTARMEIIREYAKTKKPTVPNKQPTD